MSWVGWGIVVEAPFLQLITATLVLGSLMGEAIGAERDTDLRKLPQDRDILISYPLEGLPRQPRTESKLLF
jgi:hypothetical protein